MSTPRRSIVQCAACGKHAGVQTNGEVDQCACGSWHFVSMDLASWRLSQRDVQFLRMNKIDPEVAAMPIPDASEEA